MPARHCTSPAPQCVAAPEAPIGPGRRAAPRLRAAARALTVRRGNLVWDGVIRGSGVAASAGIAVVAFAPAPVVGLVGFLVATVWVNGPLGVFLPATYEPILIIFGRVYPPVVVGAVGIVGILYVEFLNYHLYRRVLESKVLQGLRDTRVVRRVVPLFRRAPFFTVWLCAWSPLPYWAVRMLAPLADYPVPRYLAATFLGRFPRIWLFAALGALAIPTSWMMAVTFGSIALALLAFLGRPAVAVARRAGGRLATGVVRPALNRLGQVPGDY
jgi:uncharacterized membrane protein YdjX (TVP38/TMEM64 family)